MKGRARSDISEISANILEAVERLRPIASQADEDAWAEVETYIAVSLRVLAKTNRSKIKDAAMTVEIQARINGVECLDD